MYSILGIFNLFWVRRVDLDEEDEVGGGGGAAAPLLEMLLVVLRRQQNLVKELVILDSRVLLRNLNSREPGLRQSHGCTCGCKVTSLGNKEVHNLIVFTTVAPARNPGLGTLRLTAVNALGLTTLLLLTVVNALGLTTLISVVYPVRATGREERGKARGREAEGGSEARE